MFNQLLPSCPSINKLLLLQLWAQQVCASLGQAGERGTALNRSFQATSAVQSLCCFPVPSSRMLGVGLWVFW